jgi:hypothetical protein
MAPGKRPEYEMRKPEPGLFLDGKEAVVALFTPALTGIGRAVAVNFAQEAVSPFSFRLPRRDRTGV